MSRPDPLRHLAAELAQLERRGLLRVSPALQARELLIFCSNDYLGYAAEPWRSGDVTTPSGAGASRLLSGETESHRRAESVIERWLGTESALLFSSGYAANVGTLAALAGRGDVLVSDALNHASIIDGCRLSGAEVLVVPHLDAEAAERALASRPDARARWLVTEGYFSMDGDTPDLARLRAACDAHDAGLIVDEAHAVGALGPAGRGSCAGAGVVPDVLIGTLGKALGLQGAFVAGRELLRSFLWNRARSFVFSTGMSPALTELARARVVRAASDEAGRARLAANAQRLREGLAWAGAQLPESSHGPIVPWVIGSAERAVAMSRRLRDLGIVVHPIRPPTVPEGASRLRITAGARLTAAHLDRAIEAFSQVQREFG